MILQRRNGMTLEAMPFSVSIKYEGCEVVLSLKNASYYS